MTLHDITENKTRRPSTARITGLMENNAENIRPPKRTPSSRLNYFFSISTTETARFQYGAQ